MNRVSVQFFAVALTISRFGVLGFDKCLNPTDNGTIFSAEDLCIWLCTDMHCLPSSPLASRPDQANHGARPARYAPVPMWDASEANSRHRYETCRSACHGELQKLDKCDSEALYGVLADICPNAPPLKVCLTSCGCCAQNPPPPRCMVSCVRNHSGVHVTGHAPGSPRPGAHQVPGHGVAVVDPGHAAVAHGAHGTGQNPHQELPGQGVPGGAHGLPSEIEAPSSGDHGRPRDNHGITGVNQERPNAEDGHGSSVPEHPKDSENGPVDVGGQTRAP